MFQGLPVGCDLLVDVGRGRGRLVLRLSPSGRRSWMYHRRAIDCCQMVSVSLSRRRRIVRPDAPAGSRGPGTVTWLDGRSLVLHRGVRTGLQGTLGR
jgi:hypothetical protein